MAARSAGLSARKPRPGGDVRDDEQRAARVGCRVAIADRALRQALAYARPARGRGPNSPPGASEMSPIIEHADIQRMLLTMKALTHAARGSPSHSVAIDRRCTARATERRRPATRAALTPVTAFSPEHRRRMASRRAGAWRHGPLRRPAAQHMRRAHRSDLRRRGARRRRPRPAQAATSNGETVGRRSPHAGDRRRVAARAAPNSATAQRSMRHRCAGSCDDIHNRVGADAQRRWRRGALSALVWLLLAAPASLSGSPRGIQRAAILRSSGASLWPAAEKSTGAASGRHSIGAGAATI